MTIPIPKAASRWHWGGKLTLDENGDPQWEGWTFDDRGNLIRSENAEGTVVEYTYQAFKLSKADGEKALRMLRSCNLPDNIQAYALTMGLIPLEGMAGPLAVHIVQNGFYYYMIPNPIC